MDEGEGSSTKNIARPNKPKRTTPIPGPARQVQEALHRRSRGKMPETEWLPTQEYVERALTIPEYDDSFNQPAWQMVVNMGYLEMDEYKNLKDIEATMKAYTTTARIPLAVAIVKQLTPVMLGRDCAPSGDCMLVLKDPSGEMSGSAHRKVFLEGGFTGKLVVGSVIVMSNIVLFKPLHGVCKSYFNITIKNVMLVIGPDGAIHSPISSQ